MSTTEQLVELGDLACATARVRRRSGPLYAEFRKIAEHLIADTLRASSACYGDEYEACVLAKRGDQARRGRIAAACGASEALGGSDPRVVAYGFDLDANTAARSPCASAGFNRAADAARVSAEAFLKGLK